MNEQTKTKKTMTVDVICVGHASYDLIFTIDHHPAPDEKIFAEMFLGCGGGPAANAALAISKQNFTVGFIGYLGTDTFGKLHLEELENAGVNTDFVARGNASTPISSIFVKPDGSRVVVNYQIGTNKLEKLEGFILRDIKPKAILLDGHEPIISHGIAAEAKKLEIPIILDAGSLHSGTEKLIHIVDFVVASEKFARQFAKTTDMILALEKISKVAHSVVITLGDQGLVWKTRESAGKFGAYNVDPIDTTGAGDVFHGVFTASLIQNKPWIDVLRWSSAAGALCCTKLGARQGIPSAKEISEFLAVQEDPEYHLV